jgi:hypothetical protein
MTSDAILDVLRGISTVSCQLRASPVHVKCAATGQNLGGGGPATRSRLAGMTVVWEWGCTCILLRACFNHPGCERFNVARRWGCAAVRWLKLISAATSRPGP